MKRKWMRRIIGGLSFGSALFVFQACYGTPMDMGMDELIEGQVKSKTSELPIKGIKVSVVDNTQYVLTDGNGRFGFYALMTENMKIRFEDIDSTQNGLYNNKDTILTTLKEKVFLDIHLEEK
jgi:hypothetical protein